jgi:hypothetical protein
MLKRQWIFQFVAALFVCFTKEPAIISYGALCLGIVVVDFIQNRKIKEIFIKPQYYMMAVTGLLWLVTYKFLGGWSAGEGGIAIDGSYMLDKSKVLYILNFSWIFVVFCIAGFLKMQKKSLLWCMPIIISTICFTVFSMIFKTVNHARYTAQVPAVLYIIGIVMIVYLFNESISKCILAVISILLLISSFFTIDPVSKLCFETVNVGDMEMITTSTVVPGDSMIYNKQMLGFEYVLNEAFEYAVSNEYMVILPLYEFPPNLFDGLMQEEESGDYGYVAYTYWDEVNKIRTSYENDFTTPFEIYELYQGVATTTLPLEKYKKHCYIYSGLLGEDRVAEINARFSDVEYKEFSSKGWTVTVVTF